MSGRNYDILLYGSYGYTGRLIAEECSRQKFSVLLCGRNKILLKEQSEQTGFDFDVIEIDQQVELQQALAKCKVVIHCGGPFMVTARKMIEACISTGTHYLDITGEYGVFQLAKSYHQSAAQSGIMLMSGTGFDVVPTDCLAVYLKNHLPSATHLQLAFAMRPSGASRGTAKTAAMHLEAETMIRRAGNLISSGKFPAVSQIDFGGFKSSVVGISWGDIVTSYYSTGIPNIEVFMGANKKLIRNLFMVRRLSWFFGAKWIKKLMLRIIDSRVKGPSAEALKQGRCFVYGKVWDDQGLSKEVRLETPNGYTLTALISVHIASKVLNGDFAAGYGTPAGIYGSELILEMSDVKRW
jgi:short subunit dehydrogenase-like uncharacterized protein